MERNGLPPYLIVSRDVSPYR